MITAHLTVTVESRAREAHLEDLANCLELLAARLRDMELDGKEPVTDTLRLGESEINYSLVPQFPAQ
jgi:hypothetical protein